VKTEIQKNLLDTGFRRYDERNSGTYFCRLHFGHYAVTSEKSRDKYKLEKS